MYKCHVDNTYLFELYDREQTKREEKEEKCIGCYEVLLDIYLQIDGDNYCMDCGKEYFDLYNEDELEKYFECIRYESN
jgi:hypothetical protein